MFGYEVVQEEEARAGEPAFFAVLRIGVGGGGSGGGSVVGEIVLGVAGVFGIGIGGDESFVRVEMWCFVTLSHQSLLRQSLSQFQHALAALLDFVEGFARAVDCGEDVFAGVFYDCAIRFGEPCREQPWEEAGEEGLEAAVFLCVLHGGLSAIRLAVVWGCQELTRVGNSGRTGIRFVV